MSLILLLILGGCAVCLLILFVLILFKFIRWAWKASA